jgi:hypothetical protein
MPTQYFLFVMANGISAKVHKSSLIQSIKMRLPYFFWKVKPTHLMFTPTCFGKIRELVLAFAIGPRVARFRFR